MASKNVNLCVILTFLISCISLTSGISGGTPATPDDFEYMTGICQHGAEMDLLCGGAVISDNYVLASAIQMTRKDAKKFIIHVGPFSKGV